MPLALTGGQIVIADWRGDALPKEPNKLRPAIVIENDALFSMNFPNALLVPLIGDAALVIPGLAIEIEPTDENGCSKLCWAVPYFASSTSKLRIKPTASRVTPAQLKDIRETFALTIGLDI